MEYVDFAEPQNRARMATVYEEISKSHMVFPVTEIDGRLVAQGYVDYWAIADAVERKLQEGG